MTRREIPKIDLSNNINGLGVPKGLKDLMINSMENFLEYPDQHRDKENNIIAKYLNLKVNNILFGNGSSEIFFTLPRILPKGKVKIIGPTFWEYIVANKRVGNTITFAVLDEEKDFKIDLSSIDLKGIKSLYICNPNNPTCTLYEPNSILELVKNNPKVQFVVDETYLYFREDYERLTLTRFVQTFNNLNVVTSFSKFFGSPGLRLGFIASNELLIRKIKEEVIPYSVNPLTYDVLEYLLSNTKYIELTKKYFKKEAMRIANELNKMKVFYTINPTANYILIKNNSQKETKELVKRLEHKGIIVRDTSIYVNMPKNWIRFCIKTEKVNNIFLKNLKEAIYE